MGQLSETSSYQYSGYAFLWTPGQGLQNLGAGYATAINSNGDIAGETSPEGHAFLWRQDGTTQDLGTLSGFYSYAQGINSAGWVVGAAEVFPGDEYDAFLWTPAGGMQDLGRLGPTNDFAVGLGINGSGEMAGYAFVTEGSTAAPYALSWTQSGGMQSIGQGFAYAINAKGIIAGQTYSAEDFHAMVWSPTGVMTDLGTRRQKQHSECS